MTWGLVGILAVFLALLYRLYWRACGESRQLANLVVLILLDQKVHDAQRAGLIDFVTNSKTKNAADLGRAVNLAMGKVAMQMSGNTLGVAALLWNTRRPSA
jgi:hypothetical protein